jgi:hypothetical protein
VHTTFLINNNNYSCSLLVHPWVAPGSSTTTTNMLLLICYLLCICMSHSMHMDLHMHMSMHVNKTPPSRTKPAFANFTTPENYPGPIDPQSGEAYMGRIFNGAPLVIFGYRLSVG